MSYTVYGCNVFHSILVGEMDYWKGTEIYWNTVSKSARGWDFSFTNRISFEYIIVHFCPLLLRKLYRSSIYFEYQPIAVGFLLTLKFMDILLFISNETRIFSWHLCPLNSKDLSDICRQSLEYTFYSHLLFLIHHFM